MQCLGKEEAGVSLAALIDEEALDEPFLSTGFKFSYFSITVDT